MEVTIPTCWDDITLETYINLRPILQTEQQPMERLINILCVLTGKKREVIRNITLDDYHKIAKKMEFLDTPIPGKLKKRRFKIGGKWYVFKIDAKKLLFSEYISTMELMQNIGENEEVIYTSLPQLLTIVCRPIKKRFSLFWTDIKVDGELVRSTVDNFHKNMPITIAYPIGVFFYHHWTSLTKDIKTSLMRKAEKELKLARKEMREIASARTGDGGLY